MEQNKVSHQNNIFPHRNTEGDHVVPMWKSGYSHFLIQQGFSFVFAEPYLFVGPAIETDSWLIHITVVRQQFKQLIRPLLDFLKSLQVSFYIPVNAEQHSSILDGRRGFNLTAKVVTICAQTPDDAKFIAQHLLILTQSIIGPAIPYAYHLTCVIAVTYGTLFAHNVNDDLKSWIIYGSATANELKQTISLNNLQWPFTDIRPLSLFKQPRLINRQYIPIETFKKDPKGNVFKALKINRLFDMQWCVIKQGRQYQSFDNCGRDAKDRLAWQLSVHKQFETKNILPKALAYFELYGDAFFAMEYKESVSLTEKAVYLSEGHVWRTMPSERKRELLQYLIQVARILTQFHDDGIRVAYGFGL